VTTLSTELDISVVFLVVNPVDFKEVINAALLALGLRQQLDPELSIPLLP